jgi:HAD superfamily hydrolase (TIGR01662 family)
VTVGAVFFDVGETLVDEERWWRHVADAAGVGPHVVWAALGKTIERGEEHWELWHHLGVERPADAWSGVVYSLDDLYPDALSCLEEMRAAGYLVGIAGNQNAALEAWARSAELPVDIVAGSASLGCRKPDPAFFAGLVGLAGMTPHEVAYVGDRVDNDVLPALAAGMAAVHLRRGPWGMLQPTPPEAASIESLSELAAVLDECRGPRGTRTPRL